MASNLIEELKRRRVFRVAGVYIVIAWVAIQAAATIFPALELPGWTVKAVIIAGAAGLPVALVLSWLFEVRRETAPGRGRGNPLAYFGLGILVALVGYGLSSRYLLEPSAADSAVEHRTQSVIVLPFQNLSSDQEQEFFSDGITEEILNALAKLPGLHVPARTTSFSFKGKNVPSREIAAAVGVDHVLAGSVRRSGDRVRIAAQLIDARTDRHIWSQTFDRDLRDVFAVQTEIANAIADELRLRMGDHARHVQAANVDARAYELYLEGLHDLNRRGTGVASAVARFKQATEIDPTFARAWVALAQAMAIWPDHDNTAPASFAEDARGAARKALALDSTLAGAHAALGLAEEAEGRLRSAERQMARAVALDSTDAQLRMWYANLLLNVADDAEPALRQYDQAIRLDPRSTLAHLNKATVLSMLRQHEQAMPHARTAYELNRESPATQIGLAEALAGTGQRDSALALLESVKLEQLPRVARYKVAGLWALLGARDRAMAILRESPPQAGADNYAVAAAYGALGDHESALRHLEATTADGHLRGGLMVLKKGFYFDSIRNTPRFQAVLTRLAQSKNR